MQNFNQMKRTIYFVLGTLMALSSCNGNKPGSADGSENPDSVFMLDGPGSVYVPTEEEVGQYALETVQEVYEAVGQAYSSEDWQTQSNELDKKFCSKDWNATVKSVIEKDNQNPDGRSSSITSVRFLCASTSSTKVANGRWTTSPTSATISTGKRA